MFLSDAEIKRLVAEKPDFITDFVPEKRQLMGISYGLDPHGYTFRLHPRFVWFRPKLQGRQGGLVEPENGDVEVIELSEGENFPLPPYHCLQVASLETFSLPTNLVGLLFGKSTYARQGLAYNMTVVDAGFSGRLVFTVVNLNPAREIPLYPYAGIAQIMFVKANPAEVPYRPIGGRVNFGAEINSQRAR